MLMGEILTPAFYHTEGPQRCKAPCTGLLLPKGSALGQEGRSAEEKLCRLRDIYVAVWSPVQ